VEEPEGRHLQLARLMSHVNAREPVIADHHAPPCNAMWGAAQSVSTLSTAVGLSEVAVFGWERRADARGAAIAFQRLDQRRLFSAHIGAGTDVNLDVKNRNLAAPWIGVP
jgi:hypothetical protein